MRWVTASEMMGLQTLLAMMLSSTLLTTAQTRVVSSSSDSNDQSREYAGWTTDDSSNIDDGDDNDDDNSDDMDMWPVFCPPNTFYSREKDKCTMCTPCAVNTITARPCHRFEDNLCIPVTSSSSSSSSSSFSHDNNSHRYKNLNGGHTAKAHRLTHKQTDNGQQHRQLPLKVTSAGGGEPSSEWRSVSLILLVSTGVIFVFLVSLALVLCYLRGRVKARLTTKEILCKYGPAPKVPIVVEAADV